MSRAMGEDLARLSSQRRAGSPLSEMVFYPEKSDALLYYMTAGAIDPRNAGDAWLYRRGLGRLGIIIGFGRALGVTMVTGALGGGLLMHALDPMRKYEGGLDEYYFAQPEDIQKHEVFF